MKCNKENEHNFIETLIENVKANPCLYVKEDKQYYNKQVKAQTWQNIAEKCGISSEECKHRWTLLRERYCKEIKKTEENTSWPQKEWKYYESLEFLRDTLTPRKRNNTTKLSFEEDNTTLSMPEKKPRTGLDDANLQLTTGTIDKTGQSQSKAESSTGNDSFGKFASHLMKNLSEPQKDELQIKILNIIYQARHDARTAHQ